MKKKDKHVACAKVKSPCSLRPASRLQLPKLSDNEKFVKKLSSAEPGYPS